MRELSPLRAGIRDGYWEFTEKHQCTLDHLEARRLGGGGLVPKLDWFRSAGDHQNSAEGITVYFDIMVPSGMQMCSLIHDPSYDGCLGHPRNPVHCESLPSYYRHSTEIKLKW